MHRPQLRIMTYDHSIGPHYVANPLQFSKDLFPLKLPAYGTGVQLLLQRPEMPIRTALVAANKGKVLGLCQFHGFDHLHGACLSCHHY